MVKDYIEANIDTIDRNGDGVIGYVLAIGDIGHTTPSHVQEVYARLWEQALKKMEALTVNLLVQIQTAQLLLYRTAALK